MHRFFVPPEWIEGEVARLGGETARQIAAVLRMAPGDDIVLLDNSGLEYQVRLEQVERRGVRGRVVGRRQTTGEPSTSVALYQGLLKGDKLELVLQKGAELGVGEFVPLVCQRAVPLLREGWQDRRYPRWRKIVREAAEQSGRGRLPLLRAPQRLEQALACARGLRLIPWEEESARGLRQTLEDPHRRPTTSISLFIGPEGGFTPQEVEVARSLGALPVSLGRRILRSETAALAAVTAVFYHLGELGS